MTNEAAVNLPSLSVSRKQIWDYYRIEFLEDGYPGRRSKYGLHAHPIYGTYVINDYISQYRKHKDEVFLEAAKRVANAAIDRMEEHRGALVFYYQPGAGLSSLPSVFYSGLTQARYLSTFGVLGKVSPSSRYSNAAEAILSSFEVPAEDGGIARHTPSGGLLIEEYSHQVPDYTLNGWTTATTLLHEYAETTDSQHARTIFEQSIRGIRDVLPLYDVPELANSRYRLTGAVRVKLGFTSPRTAVNSAKVIIPGEGDFPLGAGSGKWTNRFVSGLGADGVVGGREAVMEILLCRVTWPEPNRLALDLTSAEEGMVTVQVGEGSYDPLSSWVRTDSYSTVAEVVVHRGPNTLDISIPWARAELVAYPTSWTKAIGGRQYNSYHFIHIDTLTTLAERTGDSMLAYYRDRWAQYPARWPDVPALAGADIVLDRYRASRVQSSA